MHRRLEHQKKKQTQVVKIINIQINLNLMDNVTSKSACQLESIYFNYPLLVFEI